MNYTLCIRISISDATFSTYQGSRVYAKLEIRVDRVKFPIIFAITETRYLNQNTYTLLSLFLAQCLWILSPL
jgi:hypothetical protein